MAWTVEPDPLRPERALRWFARRLALPDEELKALSEEARRRAFWVSGLAALDMVQEVMDALERALAEGETYEDFRRRLSERVRTAWGRGSPYRLELIFRTNLQLAYGAGRYREAERVKDLRPYWGLSVVLDGRTSRICAPLAGVVLPADHPFWRNHIPPLHYNCRTALVTYSREEGERLAWKEAPAHAPQEGFGRPPGREEWIPNPRDYHPELWGAYLRALAALPEARDRLRRLAESRGREKPDPRDWLFAAGEMARSPFNRKVRSVPEDLRPVLGEGRATMLAIHVAKRVWDGDLAPGTPPEVYERLCREAPAHPEAALFAFARAQGPVLAALAPASFLPEEVRGPRLGAFWFVVYSFHSGTLVTGYSVNVLQELDVPWEEVTWLRKPPWLTNPSG